MIISPYTSIMHILSTEAGLYEAFRGPGTTNTMLSKAFSASKRPFEIPCNHESAGLHTKPSKSVLAILFFRTQEKVSLKARREKSIPLHLLVNLMAHPPPRP